MAAYVIVDVNINDPEMYESYKSLTPATLEAYNGKFVIRGGKTETLEGSWQPGRFVMLEFPSAERAKEWWHSDVYSEAKVIRQKAAETQMLLVENADQQQNQHYDYKPKGYNSASPYLIVAGAQKLIDLLKEVFEARELRRYDMPDGSIMHVELQIDDSVIMLGDASDKFPPVQHVIHVYVPNVDTIFEKAIVAGCEVLESPRERKGDPDRRGSFRDFAGNTWSVATQL